MLYAAFRRLRGPLAGAVVAMLAIGATSALAGSGVGGVFNLGQSNTVDQQTQLSGSTGNNPQLRVENSSTVANSSGVIGRMSASSADKSSAGVKGFNDGNGAGVYGQNRTTSPVTTPYGVEGIADIFLTGGVGVLGRGDHAGVAGESDGGFGIEGTTKYGTGVWATHNGTSGAEPGVMAQTYSQTAGAYAIHGRVMSTSPGADSAAVRAENKGTGQIGFGVWASHAGGGTGLYASSVHGVGVFGASTDGLAGEFTGPVKVTGYLTLKTISGGAPPATDCDQAAEAGRMVLRTDGTTNLYICRGAGGWIGK